MLGEPTPTTTQAMVTYAAHFDPLNLVAPPAPTPQPSATVVPVQLTSGGIPGLSIPVTGNFMGFSIELSVADQIMGRSGKFIDPTFLNLMANIRSRGGSVLIRVGGNSQEKAVFYSDGLAGGATILKDKSNLTNPTDTPTIDVGVDLLYAMSNISALTNAKWFVGVPFNDTANPRLGIASASEQILGEHLLGFQVGNEPDLYGKHGARPPTYSPSDYINEFRVMMDAMGNDTGIRNKNAIVGPSVCCNWQMDDVIAAGYDQFLDNLAYISAEQLIFSQRKDITNNCKIDGNIVQPQDILPLYLSHNNVINLVQPFLNDSAWAQSNGKPYIMMETNTASCGGFPGVSDSLGAALWGVDYSLQMASVNFTAAMFHNGGQNTYYNSFTPPPVSAAKRGRKWTVGSMYYSALIVAEALGSSGNARVADLRLNGGSDTTPGYVIYEGDVPSRMVLFNYVTDPSGANNYTAQISVDGQAVGKPNGTPPQIMARYFTSSSVVDKAPFYYAGQTFGGALESDGTLQGTRDTATINCDTEQNLCHVPIPAPGLAVLFLTPEAQNMSISNDPEITFTTTATTVALRITATINPSVLATSNGYGGSNRQVGSTSFGSLTNSGQRLSVSLFSVVITMVVGAIFTIVTRVLR
ncbi:hypothetical protein Clacol_008610 [Clathrus columnatus]|uniref:Beta-glucuronidase C-terminal domain-containing protein n=1 Tax=Clathrus columnatus TaxID=1419009 RepID=A0AAV5APP0_9AGAM|nr:hypothetical protein Clacol_008610 [Clathrus columnatus]